MIDKARPATKTPKGEPIALSETDLKGASAAAATGFFTEVSGLGSENEVIEYREGGDPSLSKRSGK